MRMPTRSPFRRFTHSTSRFAYNLYTLLSTSHPTGAGHRQLPANCLSLSGTLSLKEGGVGAARFLHETYTL